MSSQRAIAIAAGVTQATVSLALRGSPLIPEKTRHHIVKIAEELGYRPNSYVSLLMAHIRAGKPVQDRGEIAILVDAKSYDSWFYEAGISLQVYRRQYEGMMRRAERLGFKTECFFLGQASSPEKIERTLNARGISNLILAAPCRNYRDVPLPFHWERYICATSGYTWQTPNVDRVTGHHRQSVDLVFRELLRRGYKRIGMSLPSEALTAVNSNWFASYLLWERQIPKENRIPLFTGKPGITPISKFDRWLKKWKPQVLVCLLNHESVWTHELNVRVPQDLELVCLNRPIHSPFSGVEENSEVIGEEVVDVVVNHALHNEYGIPLNPKLIQIDGLWIEGETLLKRG